MSRLRRFRRSRMRTSRMAGKGIYLLPNLCTTASLFFGFLSIVKSLGGHYTKAAWMILVAGIFDLLDGRIARLTGTGSRFGIEYDSLVDLTSFGLAPGILMYTWSLSSFGKLGWLIAFLYFACGALRLARFNVQQGDVDYMFFQGLPIPMAAYMLATYVIFHHHHFSDVSPQYNLVCIGMTLGAALLMVTTVRYWSGKIFALSRVDSFFALVALVALIFVIALYPETILFCMALLYVVSGPFHELCRRTAVGDVLKKALPARRRRLGADDRVTTSRAEEVDAPASTPRAVE